MTRLSVLYGALLLQIGRYVFAAGRNDRRLFVQLLRSLFNAALVRTTQFVTYQPI